ncbi:MAG: zinc ABC transporter substrate-binding protein [Bacteroidales bacterium]|nr:zinc ABC transporter substrate-binding protein [Bacteroidales bacterium]
MKRFYLYLMMAGLLSACGTGDDSSADDFADAESQPVEVRGTLAVSIEPQRKILEELVQGRYEVVTMLGQGANPETYDPTVQQKMKASKADAYFMVGYLPFEETVTKDLPKNVRISNTSLGIPPVIGTHSHAQSHNVAEALNPKKSIRHKKTDDEDLHLETDPHVWTSINNGKMIASNMVDMLTIIDPDSAKMYKRNYQRMVQRLDSLNRVITNKVSGAGLPAFAVWHPSLSYFARDYGLEQISVGQESKEASIGNIASVIKQARADSVRVFFYQKEFDSRQAESISKEIGARMVQISPLDYEWETEIMHIADELVR